MHLYVSFQPSANVNIVVTINTTELLSLLLMFYVTHAHFFFNTDESDSIPSINFPTIAWISVSSDLGFEFLVLAEFGFLL